jgi:hypothetical protein
MRDPIEALEIQEEEHNAWIDAATELRSIGFDLNAVDVITFEPARVLLCKWALAYARGHEAGIFTTLNTTDRDAARQASPPWLEDKP